MVTTEMQQLSQGVRVQVNIKKPSKNASNII